MASSLFGVCDLMKLKKVKVLTPYKEELNIALQDRLAEKGISVLAFKGLNLDKDFDIWNVKPSELKAEFIKLLRVETEAIDGVIVSCSAFRVL